MINLNLGNICLSSSLPDKFNITQADDVITCIVELDGTVVYSTTLFSNEHTATFYDLGKLINEYMRTHHIVFASFSFEVRNQGGSEVLDDITIVYSAVRHDMQDDGAFLLSHFLTTRRSYNIPHGYNFFLTFFADADEQLLVEVSAVFIKDGIATYKSYSNTLQSRMEPAYYVVSLDSGTVCAGCSVSESAVGKLASVAVRVGDRHMTVYYTSEKPTVSFLFQNAFNAQEYIHIIGKETLKSDITKKDAVCLGVSSFYDKSVEKKHLIETCHLTLDEAKWFNEFLVSDRVQLHIEERNRMVEVLISDITSEIVDSPAEQTRFKFSWRMADNSDWRLIEQPTQIFTYSYNPIFQ